VSRERIRPTQPRATRRKRPRPASNAGLMRSDPAGPRSQPPPPKIDPPSRATPPGAQKSRAPTCAIRPQRALHPIFPEFFGSKFDQGYAPGVEMPRHVEAELATVPCTGSAGNIASAGCMGPPGGSQGQQERAEARRSLGRDARPEETDHSPRPDGPRDGGCDRVGLRLSVRLRRALTYPSRNT